MLVISQCPRISQSTFYTNILCINRKHIKSNSDECQTVLGLRYEFLPRPQSGFSIVVSFLIMCYTKWLDCEKALLFS